MLLLFLSVALAATPVVADGVVEVQAGGATWRYDAQTGAALGVAETAAWTPEPAETWGSAELEPDGVVVRGDDGSERCRSLPLPAKGDGTIAYHPSSRWVVAQVAKHLVVVDRDDCAVLAIGEVYNQGFTVRGDRLSLSSGRTEVRALDLPSLLPVWVSSQTTFLLDVSVRPHELAVRFGEQELADGRWQPVGATPPTASPLELQAVVGGQVLTDRDTGEDLGAVMKTWPTNDRPKAWSVAPGGELVVVRTDAAVEAWLPATGERLWRAPFAVETVSEVRLDGAVVVATTSARPTRLLVLDAATGEQLVELVGTVRWTDGKQAGTGSGSPPPAARSRWTRATLRGSRSTSRLSTCQHRRATPPSRSCSPTSARRASCGDPNSWSSPPTPMCGRRGVSPPARRPNTSPTSLPWPR